MIRPSRSRSVVTPLAALAVVLVLACGDARAQVKPFLVKGEGSAPEGLLLDGNISPYSMSGTATYLGKYTGIGIAQVTGPGPVVPGAVATGSFTGGFVFVAANGDKLVCKHPGTFAVFSDGADGLFAVFDAVFSPSSLTIGAATYTSTGRFANVGGSFRMIAVTESFGLTGAGTTPFDLEWRGVGALKFPKK